MPWLTTLVKKVACGMSSLSRCGMFSWPSGMKVSSSRAPPPKVTTTALRFFGSGHGAQGGGTEEGGGRAGAGRGAQEVPAAQGNRLRDFVGIAALQVGEAHILPKRLELYDTANGVAGFSGELGRPSAECANR